MRLIRKCKQTNKKTISRLLILTVKDKISRRSVFFKGDNNYIFIMCS